MNNVIMLIVAAFKKWGLGLLFILIGISWTLVNPLIRLGMVGADYFENGGTPWSYVTGAQWVVSLICLALGVLFFIRKFKPSVKLPEYVFMLAFGVFTLFALADFINVLGDISFYSVDELNHAPSYITTYYAMRVLSGIFNVLGLAGVVALMLFKNKFKKFAFIPGLVHVIGVLFLAIGNIVLASEDIISRVSQSDLVTSIIVGLMFTFAILAYSFIFVLTAPTQEEPATEAAEQTEADVEIDVDAMDSVVATHAAPQPQLTAAQKEELANAQELFELGAYSEEEFEAEKQRIISGL